MSLCSLFVMLLWYIFQAVAQTASLANMQLLDLVNILIDLIKAVILDFILLVLRKFLQLNMQLHKF